MMHLFSKKTAANSTFRLLTTVYITVLLFVTSIACFFSYRQRKETLLSEMDSIYVQLCQDYANTLDNFWQLYLPLYERGSIVYQALQDYFTTDIDTPLSPMKRAELSDILRQILIRDNQAQWIALYSKDRQDNYIMSITGASLYALSDTFPYLEELQNKQGGMEVYGKKDVTIGTTLFSTFALCGSTRFPGTGNYILVGYSTSSLEEICNNTARSKLLPSATFLVTTQNKDDTPQILFCSAKEPSEDLYFPTASFNGILSDDTTKSHLYVKAAPYGNSTSILSYQLSQNELFLYSHKNTPLILLIVLSFSLFSVFVYYLMLKNIIEETNVIQKGLDLIGDNHLDYRLPTTFKQNGFSAIATSINQMANSLKNNIDKIYSYELKQKESELAELQSKFNPHFLYNSLEMLRSRCYQNGDEETASLISSLSGIFRGFISSKTFIPISEEFAFTRKYLTLFGARYRDQVEIIYDIDSEVFQYGIIRNLFQPIVENYFVHGIEPSSEEGNYICIRGKVLNDTMLSFVIEDNGIGMTDPELEALNASLNEPVRFSSESYGLKNIQQRLRLFYGEDCGLTITHNTPKGLRQEIRILKLTCEEYEKKTP